MSEIHKEDCFILRGNDEFARLMDCEGDVVFKVPESWTDEQILYAVDIANAYYEKGEQWGEIKKQQQIKTCLGL